MNVFLWHVHGSWTTAFVQGAHDYFVPVTPDRGPDGRGRAQTWEWPARVHEVSPADACDLPVDVLLLQRPSELVELAPEWLGGRRPGRDVATVYLEHNTPADPLGATKHPVADRDDLTLVHVTHWNALFWDTGTTETRVIEHGIVDPGYRYTGELAHLGIVINDGSRRGRATGIDLVDRFARAGPIDLFGFDAARLGGTENLSQAQLHEELARRRVYVHPNRWTSLGLSLIEAMHLGLPVVAVAATEVPEAVPRGCGYVSTDVDRLVEHARVLLHEPELARQMGCCARKAARRRYGLRRFLDDWDALLEEVTETA